MPLSRLKPVPKFLAIAVIVGGLVYGVQFFMKRQPAEPVPAPVAVEQVTAPTQPAEPATQPAAPAEQPAALKPAEGNDAGLANVLNAGKK